MSQDRPIVEFKNISKCFGQLKANDDLNFKVQQNSIHALIGENGAGKSTAMKLLFGLHTPDTGQIIVRGQPVEISNPIQARQLGIGMVQQHFVLAQEHTALDNILFSETSNPFQFLNRKAKKIEYQKLAEKFGFEIEWDRAVNELSVGAQQRIEILKVLRQNAEILILDEPTAVLTPQEVSEFFKNLKLLQSQGKTIIVITHKLKEVMSITDSMTVLRQGRVISELKTSETTADQVAEQMVGRRIRWTRRDLQVLSDPQQEPILEISGTNRFDFKVKAGELVGIAGVEGNGQAELIKRILSPIEFSRDQRFQISLCGKNILHQNISQFRQNSVGIFPEDRQRFGSVAQATVKENFVLGYDWDEAFSKSGLMNWQNINEVTKENLKKFDVRPIETDHLFKSYSGGNQQKIVAARELRRKPRFLLAAQPTRGVDVGAVEFIHEQLLQAQERGAGVLLISTELDELLKLSTRILVLYKGQFVFEIPRQNFDEFEIGRAMCGITR